MKTFVVRLSVALAIALATGLSYGRYTASDYPALLVAAKDWEDQDHSHDRARRASAAGEILSIAAIYERARLAVPGRILEAELDRSHGRWVYEIKVLSPQGRLFELKLDAATGRVLDREESD
jgi:uncharacterized membrane protein YkoI